MKLFRHLGVFIRHKQSVAVGSAFLLLGIMFGSWATFIPYIKDKFQLDDGDLGLMLLFFPIGATLFNPVSAFVIKKFGMKSTTFWGMIAVSVVYVIPVNAPSVMLVSTGLCLTGMAIAVLNVAMNTCTSVIEQNEGINTMSTSHGLFSVGLMSGSLIASLSYGQGFDPGMHMVVLATLGVGLAFWARKSIFSIIQVERKKSESLSPDEKEQKPPGIGKEIFWMVLLSVCSNFTEGTMADWTAVYMKEIVQTNAYFIGWGLAAYSMCMALGRLMGDGMVPLLGARNVLLMGAAMVFIGLGLSILLPTTVISIVGFALVGYGVSFSSPILYGSAARIPGYGNGKGLAILNSFGMIGFLVGPVIIGFLSRAYDLRLAFCLILLLATIWGTLARNVKLY
ncbi:MAG: MFS transporter [Saprospiraceae bacterium]|nr:MFS transporter [Saprospiraceae bacterium]